MTDDLIGKQLGGYEIEDRIGHGGMATVYRARQTSMNRVVALKILPRHLLKDDTYLQRFEREVKIVSQLEHRNIVPVYDYGEHDGQPYIAMRYMPAGSVDDLLRRGPLTPDVILSIVNQVAPALDYAHNKQVLHRDLKPSNILLDDGGGAFITDFGIARILGTESHGATITTQGVVGTPSYMSPEQAQGKDLDGRSDIYSLGVMLFEMFTGRRPFESETPYGVAVMQVTTPPPSPRAFKPEISGPVEVVVLKALKKKPENRYQTAAELAESLKKAIENPTTDLHDTEPRPLLSQGGTQPTPMPPPPPVYHNNPTPTSPSQPMRPPVMKRKRSNNFWLSVVLGSVIGCGLLGLMVAVALLIASNLLSDDEQSPTAVPSPAVVVPQPGDEDTTATPVFTVATPIPSRTPVQTPVEVLPSPTFAPDFNITSSQIVYFSFREGRYDIFLLDLRTGEEARLTDDLNTSSYPQISPDGTRMVFQSNRDGDFDIYVMNLESRLVTRLTDNDYRDRIPSWSPDGQWVVYSSDTRGDGNFDIYRIPASGGTPELIYSDGQRNSHVRYSYDGRYLVFTSGLSGDANTWEIVRLDLATGETLQLTDNDVRDASPSFSRNNQTVLFTTAGEGNAAIAVMPADGGEVTVIHDDPGYEWGMHYSPDGQFIIFNSQQNDGANLYLIRADGSGLRPVDTLTGGFYPSWIS